jgi:hypothetical protein
VQGIEAKDALLVMEQRADWREQRVGWRTAEGSVGFEKSKEQRAESNEESTEGQRTESMQQI